VPWQELARQLAQVVGGNQVLADPADLAVYAFDAETLDRGVPNLVVLPGSTEEVQEVVRLAHRQGVPVIPRGAGTGLSGGATAIGGGIMLVLARMTKILEIDPANRVAHVQAGVTNLAVSRACQQYGLYFAPDPSSANACTIGGNLAENAGGAHTLKYGLTRSNVLGTKVVLADGTVTVCGGTVRDSLGLDLLGAFIGSEGTIGVATEAWLTLMARPHSVRTMLAYFASVAAGGQAVSDIVATGVLPAAMEMIDNLSLNCVEDSLSLGLRRDAGALLIVELDGPGSGIAAEKDVVERCTRDNGCLELRWARDEAERSGIWKARKSAFGALGRLAPHGYVLDGVIPRSKLSAAIEAIDSLAWAHRLTIASVYHAGDGNLHPCLLFNRANADEIARVVACAGEILELCVNLGGTLSGEHGIGIEKLRHMPAAFTPDDLSAMACIKAAFDPGSLFNPGKLLPAAPACGESGLRALKVPAG
jgi:glycolate oxidase